MSRRVRAFVLMEMILLLGGWDTIPCRAQLVPPESSPPGLPDRNASILGRSPGAGSNILGESPGEAGTPVFSRAGRSHGAVIQPNAGQGQSPSPSGAIGIVTPAPLPRASLPPIAAMALPERLDDEGPSDGLTLDDAIARLIADNLDLRTQFQEIPQAQADILTASLRANPLFYADANAVPYGTFSPRRPGGQTQYDVAVSLPIDVTRKRLARTAVACRAKRVLEAQFQDAVRLQIDNLYTAYLDVLDARESARFALAAVEGLRALRSTTADLVKAGQKTKADISLVEVQVNAAELGYRDALTSIRKAKQNVAALLNVPPDQADAIELRGSIRVLNPLPPPDPELVSIALESRPDVQAYRLGIARAEADVGLAVANRYPDVYVTATPYVFQNNAPFGTKSAHSWSIAVTAPIPLYNRNQGNIVRSRLNVVQTRAGLAALERRIAAEVFRADQEYDVTRAAVEEIERELLPAGREVLEDARRLYLGGESDIVDYLGAQREFNATVRLYRDNLIRHRRSMLDLNTALGRRVLP